MTTPGKKVTAIAFQLKTRGHRGRCFLAPAWYEDKTKGLRILSGKTGELVLVATESVKGVEVEQDEVLICDWGRNQGVYKSLRKAGVIHEQHGWVRARAIHRALRCRLTERGLELFPKRSADLDSKWEEAVKNKHGKK